MNVIYKSLIGAALLLVASLPAAAVTYYMAPGGSDANPGTIARPFATINKAQSVMVSGDTLYFRGGTYKITERQVMQYSRAYAQVFLMNRSGSPARKTCYWGYPGERPVFDLSEVKPSGYRVTVFQVSGSDLYFKNFEITGTQVTITTHTQSECFRNDGGSRNIYENLAMHDGMAIGFYLVRGSNNLVLNCDAYNNYDPVSERGRGGNVDGFGGHANTTGSTGNTFRGCRAWYNSDDGFDLIGAQSAVTIENCWAFYNGYKPPRYGNLVSAGDGNGFKAGGYGMGTLSSSEQAMVSTDAVPVHVIKKCIAFANKASGFYANHHLGGITWQNNTAYKNRYNFNMVNRQRNADPAIAVDVNGYGHVLENNRSYFPRTTGADIVHVNETACIIAANSFLNASAEAVSENDFMSIDPAALTLPRQPGGSLPLIDFLRLKAVDE
ncbi:right-handed parallel beta-helix repeat-containing protein [Niabella hirudinis]|uniref:right-handed parallel beta-helix repeat-containing protein n=1 Tax=Niabella hirudinis TaxID=1285929 RepID=UPI003EBD16E3